MDAPAYLVKRRDGYSWVVNPCPYCGFEHSHGGGPFNDDPQKYLGDRVAHCFEPHTDPSAGYNLVAAEGPKPPEPKIGKLELRRRRKARELRASEAAQADFETYLAKMREERLGAEGKS